MTSGPRDNPCCAARHGRCRRTAFTMIELIVVSVLLVVLASVIAPRMVGGEARRARATAGAVQDLLTAAGEREAMTSQAVTLDFDADAQGGPRLSLLSAPAPEKALTPDLLVAPIVLDGLDMERCTAGGIVLNRARWQVPLREGERRPSIALILQQEGGARFLVSLSSDAVSATLTELGAGEGTPAAIQGAIDLDQSGRRDDPW